MTTTTKLRRAPRDIAGWVWWPGPDVREPAEQYALAARICALTGSPTEPDEPTYFARATADGAENSVDDDDTPLDVTDLM